MSDAPGDAEAGPLREHEVLRDRYEAERVARDATAGRFSMAQLALFGGAVVVGGSGLFGGSSSMMLSGAGIFALFLLARMMQSRVLNQRDAAKTRRDIHDRHLQRMKGAFDQLPPAGAEIPPGHPYASDLDLVGAASLLQRLDTTHTAAGAKSLAGWLTQPASTEVIEARQEAVEELASRVELRQELEAAVLDTGRERLNAEPFVRMMAGKGIFEARPWLVWLTPILPLTLIALYAAGHAGWIPSWLWLVPLVLQIGLVRQTEKRSREVYEAMGSKKGFVDAYARLFEVIERAQFSAPELKRLRQELEIEGAPPSVQMRRLDRWVGWYELRETGIVWVVVNPLLLWDLNCLIGIERWIRHVGRKCDAWFDCVGEIEALASLSVLLHQDAGARLPEIVEEGAAFLAEGIAHPLLPSSARVANDVSLRGPGSCLIVTGSNMAGKSTLLRAVGVNIALALAGGPVIARSMQVPRVRLRASMRVADSLQTGASYFQAELARLRLVVSHADERPPVFFLLDELLRGTNAKARHLGARAVVTHLLDRGAMGLVATHDVALSELEKERPASVANVHFTDVILDGEMTFDYRLRPGVVKTSNALRLLSQVGIEVEDDPPLAQTPAELSDGADAP